MIKKRREVDIIDQNAVFFPQHKTIHKLKDPHWVIAVKVSKQNACDLHQFQYPFQDLDGDRKSFVTIYYTSMVTKSLQ